MNWQHLTLLGLLVMSGNAQPARVTSEPIPQREPRHVSLLIGIADYQYFSAEGAPGKTDLRGPLNDVERVSASLRRWGFGGPPDTRVLRNGEASRAGMLAGLRWLAERATDSADVVVVFYSGHGSFARDNNGDEASASPADTLDEVLVPADARDIHNPREVILDDEIRSALAALRTRNVTLILDACYSGTATRGPESAPLHRAKGPMIPAGGEGPTLDPLDRPEHTLITAASANQTAEELPFQAENRVFGAFTYHLTRALDGADGNTRYDELMQQVRMDVSGSLLPQRPQLEGDRGARLFRVQGDIPSRPYATLAPAPSGAVRLNVGAIHGVRDSALYDVFAPNETAFRGSPLAQVRIVSVAETSSTAQQIGQAKPIAAGSRAVAARVPFGAETFEKLPVFVAPEAAVMRAAIESLTFVRIVSDTAAAEASVSVRSGQTSVSRRGIVLPKVSDDEDICSTLRRAFAIASFERVQNPQSQQLRRVDVRVRVVPENTTPDNTRVSVDSAFVGERYDVYVRVNAPQNSRFFLTAAIAGYTSTPAVIYPIPGDASAPIELNKWEHILGPVPMTEPAGLEVLKVVVDSNQFDFNSLVRTFPACDRSRSPKGDWTIDPSPITGWKAVEHRVLILPARSGG
jgi:hypothetical protein